MELLIFSGESHFDSICCNLQLILLKTLLKVEIFSALEYLTFRFDNLNGIFNHELIIKTQVSSLVKNKIKIEILCDSLNVRVSPSFFMTKSRY